jgi:hypothetical protein
MLGRHGILLAGAIDDVDTADELLGLHEWTVGDKRLPVADLNRGGGFSVLQRVPIDPR